MIGCGYLGAVHAVAMAKLGHDVVGIDIDPGRISQLSSGQAPFYEPELSEMLSEALATGRLRFTTDFADVVQAEVHFIAVGTPQESGGDAADLRFVDAAVDSLLPHLEHGSLVVGKSTVPVGTAERIAHRLTSVNSPAVLAWNPEFLREGFAVQDTLRPDRIVYGLPEGEAGVWAEGQLDAVYQDVLSLGTPKVAMNYATAELVKVAANAFLATKISFINAMAEVSEVVGADVTQLADALGHDARIGRQFLNAGVGFGGGCLPKDIRAFVARAEELGRGESLAFLREVDAINLRRRQRVVRVAEDELGGSVEGRRIAILGVSFKPDSDDIRDSPGLEIAQALHAKGAAVTAADPQGADNARARWAEIDFTRHASSALQGAELVILATEWREFRDLDPERAFTLMSPSDLSSVPVIIDGRNVLDPDAWRSAGWKYIGMGR